MPTRPTSGSVKVTHGTDSYDTFGAQPRCDRLARLGLLLRQQIAAPLHERDLRAEALKRLAELAADRPAADDREAVRPPAEVEDGLVGERMRGGEAVELRDHW